MSRAWVLVFCILCFWLWSQRQTNRFPIGASDGQPSAQRGELDPPSSADPVDSSPSTSVGVQSRSLAEGFCGGRNPPHIITPFKQLFLVSTAPLIPTQRRLLRAFRHGQLTDEDVEGLSEDSEWARVFRAMLAERRGELSLARSYLEDAERDAMTRGNRIRLAYFVGKIAEKQLDVTRAIEAYSVYVENQPEEVVVAQRVARLKVHQEITSGYERVSEAGLTLVYPPESLSPDGAEELLARVSEVLEEAAELTGTELRPELAMVVYPSRSELLATTCVPMWTGGIYDGVVRMVQRKSPEHFDTILRHELFHAHIDHAVPHKIPAWLNEGLAQFFAGEKPQRDVMLERMLEHQTWVPFSSLGDQFHELDARADARLAYRQSALMIDWVVDEAGERAIAEGIEHLAHGGDHRDVLALMLGADTPTGSDFLEYLERR